MGPPEIAAAATDQSTGRPMRSTTDFRAWVDRVDPRELAEPFTYVVDVDGVLRLAPRHSEHVACAGGGPVLAAGEVTFVRRTGGAAVVEVTNQSTGYCPEPSCWPAVAEALDRAGLDRPGGFTAEFVFRCCPRCAELNVVKEAVFVCAMCGDDLPASWNLGAPA
ncbi:hypothetical protein GA0070611_5642 [Micromonospora auratinigra]|uniref:Uncharacterized protein n=1 Tax=Micromonospora auratinigra TaxID=261654 RepID=A0A1A9A8M1_9ACTN|nr:hypothetical protein GA0070611_5642 [Micromonospora auratinigra]